MIRSIERFALKTLNTEQTGTSALLFDGRRVSTVTGSCIDGQFEWNDLGFIVLVLFDDIFSAVETIYFLDRGGQIRDKASLGNSMAEGLISDIAVRGPDSVSLKFPMDKTHTIQIQRRSAWLGLKTRWLLVQ